jgi:putative membrane protein
MQGDLISRRYRIVALSGLLGVALLMFIAIRSRAAEVLKILEAGGGWALIAASLYRIVPVELNAAAWGVLLGKRRLGWATTLRLRWIGEAVNALLPAAQVGGDFVRARLLTAGGVPAGEATAAMVDDVAIGAFTQVLFTFLGAAALVQGATSDAPASTHFGWLALVIGIGVSFAALLIVVARVGVGRLLTAVSLHLNERLAARLRTGGAAVDRALRSMRGRPHVLLASAAWHLAAWLAQVVETWMVLRLLGRPIGWVAALAIESLAASARGAAFVVPGGIGVQEGALVAVGAAFGVSTPAALALGIVKRGRELVVGAPAIAAWVIAERHSIATFWSRRHMKERRVVERAVTSPSLTVMRRAPRLRVGVLVDLYWSPTAGGHVKTWERLAATAAEAGADIDLTVHFLGDRNGTHLLGPHVRYQIHPPLFSSARLPFLSNMPDSTDLAPHNPLLTPRLRGYDVIHTTDGTFASARTAARVSRWHGIPLTSSVHTTTPYYTRVFTAATVQRLAGSGRLSRLLLDRWAVPQIAEAHMQRLLDDHHRRCAVVLASRPEDRARLAALLGTGRVGLLRRGIERDLFNPTRRDRAWLSATFGIPPDRRVVISVGRLDAIKNVLVLARAVRQLVDQGLDLQLFCAGKGADRDAVTALLGDRVTCPGVLPPPTLARVYASADLCAQPALVEELSNAVIEAASSGLPLVVAAGSGSERFVVEGKTGLVSREATPQAWAEALAQLIADPARAAAMGREAHAWSLVHAPTWQEVLVNDLLPAWRTAAEQYAVAAERSRGTKSTGGSASMSLP